MAAATPNGGRRPRRSTRVSQTLQRARERNAEQLAEQKRRERLVEEHLVDYIEAGDVIAAEHAALEDRIAALHHKIDQARTESEQKMAGQHARQARAAWAIHEQGGRSAAQVCELLELRSEKEARRLIAAGRTHQVDRKPATPLPNSEQARSGDESRELASPDRGRHGVAGASGSDVNVAGQIGPGQSGS